MNALYYGDNLKILRDYNKDESVGARTGAQASLLARRDSVSSSSPTKTVTPEEPALQAGMLALQSYPPPTP